MGRSIEQWAALISTHVAAGCTGCVGYFDKEDAYFSIDGVPGDPDDDDCANPEGADFSDLDRDALPNGMVNRWQNN
jgi:hypothetical protein